jgi:chemotaxis protein methyltransferase CheR
LVQELKAGNEALSRAVIEAMTIRDTSFFRDPAAFDAFRDVLLLHLWRVRLPRRRFSIWSAACATGPEPYSLAMMFAGLPQFAGWDIEILATDVSAEAIAHAKEGLFSQAEVQRGLPVRLLGEYFRQEGDSWRVSDSIRSRVQFRVFNLLDPFAGLGIFDAILCRNVLMYFDAATKAEILRRLSDALVDDGYLMLGAAETVLGSSSSFLSEGPVRGITVKASRTQKSRATAVA